MDRYYLLENDWKDLEDEIRYVYQNRKDTQDKLIRTLEKRKEGLVTDAAYNVLLSTYRLFDEYWKELKHIRSHGRVVPSEEGTKSVPMGAIVVVRNITDDKNRALDIRCYCVSDNNNACSAILTRLLVGAIIGEICSGSIY